MDTVQVTRTATVVRVVAPYLPKMVKAARGLGGEFSDRTWTFAIRHDAAVRAMLMDCYGMDGTPQPLVTVRFPWEHPCIRETSRGSVSAFGRPVVRVFGRDSGAKMQSGAVCTAGGFGSGGSVKNWTLTVKDGTMIQMVDVPETMALAAQAEDATLEIVRPEAALATLDRAVLEDERARLLARVHEIDLALSEGAAA